MGLRELLTRAFAVALVIDDNFLVVIDFHLELIAVFALDHHVLVQVMGVMRVVVVTLAN